MPLLPMALTKSLFIFERGGDGSGGQKCDVRRVEGGNAKSRNTGLAVKYHTNSGKSCLLK